MEELGFKPIQQFYFLVVYFDCIDGTAGTVDVAQWWGALPGMCNTLHFYSTACLVHSNLSQAIK